jgi:hypothetical protein
MVALAVARQVGPEIATKQKKDKALSRALRARVVIA